MDVKHARNWSECRFLFTSFGTIGSDNLLFSPQSGNMCVYINASHLLALFNRGDWYQLHVCI